MHLNCFWGKEEASQMERWKSISYWTKKCNEFSLGMENCFPDMAPPSPSVCFPLRHFWQQASFCHSFWISIPIMSLQRALKKICLELEAVKLLNSVNSSEQFGFPPKYSSTSRRNKNKASKKKKESIHLHDHWHFPFIHIPNGAVC